ncbi:GCN5-related N-acetyltransferase [Collimonas arenae]|uniref:GCN5-related N-acetyltransferase n=1 Tax=Collimonas arenae TaxID=279058 RepID=A0A0A1FGJ5_9BURK|nr:GNAT family N-acetyltransferase [Collimonas arenae]AIY42027.1 GCN5-related N-acetyltransferase [Collimonas arenae]
MSNNLTSPAVRAMHDNDIASVMRIQAECYPPSMQESEEVFRARLALTPTTCWIWSLPRQSAAAYLFCYPSQKDAITALGDQFKIAAMPDCLYLHDLAVSPSARGQRAANTLVAAALNHARGNAMAWSALVSVQQSQSFWGTLGYASVEVQHSPARENLDSYRVAGNQNAPVYMLQRLT